MKRWIILAVSLLTAAVIVAACIILPTLNDTGTAYDALVYISEVMPSNHVTLSDSDGRYPDWIEIRNYGEHSVPLGDFYISDEHDDPYKNRLPDVALEPGESILLLADGKENYDIEKQEYHIGFKVNSVSSDLYLTSLLYAKNDHVQIRGAVSDYSYGITALSGSDALFAWMNTPTPGKENDISVVSDDPKTFTSPYEGLVISEYMSRNSTVLSDSDGDYPDWVEIQNTSDRVVSLDGLFISDDETKLCKWEINGNIRLEKGQCAVVFLSGKDRCDTELHASFKLGSSDRVLTLGDKYARVVDRIELSSDLPEDCSYGRSSIGSYGFLPSPTPGKPNSTISGSAPGKNDDFAGSIIRINEVSAAAVSGVAGKSQSDWIEIYNASDTPFDLTGCGLTNDESDPYRYKFPSMKLGAHKYYVIYANNSKAKSNYAPFKVSSHGETLMLISADGRCLDVFETGKMRIGVTSGRDENGNRAFFTTATSGKANSTALSAYAPEPVFSLPGGCYKGTQKLTVSVPENAVVRYTTNGSEPTAKSKEYTAPITIKNNTVIRAKAYISGLVASDTVTATYLINASHSVPVVCLTGDHDGFFSESTGIYANGPNGQGHGDVYPFKKSNYWKNWERRVCVEYMENGAEAAVFNAGTKIFGQYTRTYPQKSFALHLRDVYGDTEVSYPFFENSSHSVFSALVLRAGGQDQNLARIRDAFISQIVLGSDTTVLTADWCPAAVYINGEYWGLYDLREKINEEFLERYCGIPSDNVSILKGPSQSVLSGSRDSFRKILQYVKHHDMSAAANYQYIESQVDIDNYIDFVIFETFFKNNDLGNTRYYKENKSGAKWRWILYDMDMSLRSDAINGHYTASLKEVASKETLHRNLLKNKTYKEKFIARYAELLNTTFMPSNLTSVLDSMTKRIDPEIKKNSKKWTHTTYSEWKYYVKALRKICLKRRDFAKKQLKSYFNISSSKMKKLFPKG